MTLFTYLGMAVFASIILSLNKFRFFPIDETSLFITVIGLLYGLIAAFVINNSWERFSKIRDAVTEETTSLLNIYYILKKIGDRKILQTFSARVTEYCTTVIKTEWDGNDHRNLVHRDFGKISAAIHDAHLRTPKDEIRFQLALEEMHDAYTYKGHQLVLAETKLSPIQWMLLLFLSTILVTSIVFLSLPLSILSFFISTTMIMSILLILLVIRELDTLKIAENEVSIAPYIHIMNVLKEP